MSTSLAVGSIEIEGFLSIRSATVELGPLNALIGANGAGKSNFVRAFEFIGRLAERQIRFHVPGMGGALRPVCRYGASGFPVAAVIGKPF